MFGLGVEATAQIFTMVGIGLALAMLFIALFNFLKRDIKNDIGNIRNDMDEMKDDIKQLRCDVNTLFQTVVFRGNSPLILTDRGKEIIDMINGTTIITLHKDELFHEIKDRLEDNSLFTIQNTARDVITEHIKDYLSDKHKEILSNQGIDMPLLCKSMSIQIRDMYINDSL